MIYNDNNSTSKVFYSGFTITKVYACGGELVWSSSPYAFKAMYTLNDSTTGKVSCNSDSTLRYTDFGDQSTNVMYLTVGECVDNFETHLVSLMYSSLRTIDLTNSSITSLPSNFLNGVSTLREATLNPNTTTIGSGAFGGCTSLSDITIPSSVTSIELGAFRNSGLRDAIIYSGITYGNQVYSMCSSLSSVTIEEGTRSIPNGTFALSSGITEVTIPSSVTYVGSQAFIGCYGLSEVTCLPTTPPNLGEEDVFPSSCIIYVHCSAMSAYTAHSDWQPYIDRLRPIEDNCETIIYRWQPSGTTCIDVDKYQNNIKQISYNSGATWSNVSPSEYSASTLIERNSTDCGYIEPQYRTISTAVTCSGVDKYKVDEHQESLDGGVTWTTTSTTIGDLIQANSYDCGYRTRTTSGTPYCVDVDKYQDVYSEYSTDSGTTWITASTTPTLIEHNSEDCGYVPPIEPQYRTLTTATTCVGYDKHVLEEHQESLDGGVTWTTTATTTGSLIEADSEDCGYIPPTPTGFKYKLTLSNSSIVSAECDSTSAVTQAEVDDYVGNCVDATFGDCVTSIGTNSFNGFKNLTAITLSDSLITIGDSAFERCSGFTNINIPNSVTSIGQFAFYACRSLTNVTIGSGVTSISQQTFVGCSSLTSVTIPNSVTSIGDWVFRLCTSLSSVTIPDSVTSIGVSAFEQCTSLTSIDIPSGVTSIGDSAFSGCTSLSSCTIGSGVTSIGGKAFQNCSGLIEIIVEATTPPSLGLRNYEFDGSTCPIYVPCESVEAYKSATGWSYYASRITCKPTPTYEWVSYASGDTVPTATTVYGVRIYPLYDSNYNVTFSGSNGDYIRLYPDGFSDWSAEDENGTPIDISSYRIRPGYTEYEIPFSDLGMGGMNIISPTTIFKDDIDLYIPNS